MNCLRFHHEFSVVMLIIFIVLLMDIPLSSSSSSIPPKLCPGRFCGRIGDSPSCGACPWGYRRIHVNESIVDNAIPSLCVPCTSSLSAHEALFLIFHVALVISLHIISIFYFGKSSTAPSTSSLDNHDRVTLVTSAIIEVVTAIVVAILLFEPRGRFFVHTCGVYSFQDWYPAFYNPHLNYTTKLACASEVVFPLYTLIFTFYALCIITLLVGRLLIADRFFAPGLASRSVYAALLYMPLLTLCHVILAGPLFYVFPFLLLGAALVANTFLLSYSHGDRSILRRRVYWFSFFYIFMVLGIVAVLSLFFTNNRKDADYEGSKFDYAHLAWSCLAPIIPTVIFFATQRWTDPAYLRIL